MADHVMRSMQAKFEAEERRREMRWRTFLFLSASAVGVYFFSPYIFSAGSGSQDDSTRTSGSDSLAETRGGSSREQYGKYGSSATADIKEAPATRSLGIMDYLFYPSDTPASDSSSSSSRGSDASSDGFRRFENRDTTAGSYSSGHSSGHSSHSSHSHSHSHSGNQGTYSPPPTSSSSGSKHFHEPGLGTNIRYKPNDDSILPVSPAVLFLCFIVVGFAGFCFGWPWAGESDEQKRMQGMGAAGNFNQGFLGGGIGGMGGMNPNSAGLGGGLGGMNPNMSNSQMQDAMRLQQLRQQQGLFGGNNDLVLAGDPNASAFMQQTGVQGVNSQGIVIQLTFFFLFYFQVFV